MVYQSVKSDAIASKTKDIVSHSSNRSSDKQKVQQISESYDPFGVNRAVLKAISGPSRRRAAGAKLVSSAVFLAALLPLVLVIPSAITVTSDKAPLLLRAISCLFLLWTGLFVVDQVRQLMFNHSDLSMQPTAENAGKRGSVIVIGAGPVGLAIVKECKAEGLDVRCFDRQVGVGGAFRFNRDFAGGCWPAVKLTTSPWVTAYSDFPPDSTSSEHYTAQQYVNYLERYVRHFKLAEHLNFKQTVTSVKPSGAGGWVVVTVDRQTKKTQTHYCDRVAVSVGLNLNPKPIDLPGQETFLGEVRHASTYTGPEGLEGKRVVVVGAGESGVDIATELSHTACETYLSLRSGKLVIPRTNPLNGVANDYDTNRIRYSLPASLRDWFMTFERRICFHTGDHTPEAAFRAQLLSASNVGPSSQTVTKSDDFVHRAMAGKLSLRKNVVGFDPAGVIFADGVRQPADVVIFAHGYVPAFPFLNYPDGVAAAHPGDMFLNMFHPKLGDSIAFCGFARPAIGAIPPTGELQARLFAQVAAGDRILPTPSNMMREIERAQAENAASFPAQPQPNAVINWIPYMDKLARLIGCKPEPRKFWRQPTLLWRLCTGPMTGAYYRLYGPNQDAIAFETVRSLPRMHRISEILIYLGLHFWSWPLQILHPHPRWRRFTTIM